MPDDIPTNVLPFQRRQKSWTIAEMSLWFQTWGRRLGRMRFTPEAFVVVLINGEDQQLYRYGPSDLQDDAIHYALADAIHRTKGQRYPDLYPPAGESLANHRAARVRQRAEQAAYEAEYPWVCEACTQRFMTAVDYDAHQQVGHHCRHCYEVLRTVDAWADHACEEGSR